MRRPIARVPFAVVLGGASCLWDDVEALRALMDVDAALIVACNDAGAHWPGRLDHWVTLHPEQLEARKAKRAELGYPEGFMTWTRLYPYGLKERERMADHAIDTWGGGSGLHATKVALIHAERPVLCGIPMTKTPHFNRNGKPWNPDPYWAPWPNNLERLRNVRSMSGRTRDLLGAPTEAWLTIGIARSA